MLCTLEFLTNDLVRCGIQVDVQCQFTWLKKMPFKVEIQKVMVNKEVGMTIFVSLVITSVIENVTTMT